MKYRAAVPYRSAFSYRGAVPEQPGAGVTVPARPIATVMGATVPTAAITVPAAPTATYSP